MDMPVNFQQALAKIDIAKIQQAVEDYGPVIEVVRGTWDHATLAEMAEGKLYVSDDMMNEAIAKQIDAQDENAPVTAVKLASHENGRLDITADTRKIGPVELSGTIEEFVHDGEHSYMKYHVRSKNIPQHGLMSWVFSRISLSMAERMVGHIDLPENVPVQVRRNTVTVDFHQVLVDSALGQTQFQGHPLLDMVEIKSATPKDGGILFETELHVPDDVKAALLRMAQQKKDEMEKTETPETTKASDADAADAME
ncbi:hypothetical protein [Selenomonas sp.]|uniref:hypothetical protein n=1 Tax=Selenomonas sp. TaxID=2053611 RepID=UPI0025D0A723|nr:hypothetical protein [Selenomonas sp.]MCI6086917.1 hypothetical protein [Selenomonas sp.]MDY3296958.1 hypothetical protein [Selenomonas sp.]MDY4416310.1 hypothetical protein [Selenomonas sp.]